MVGRVDGEAAGADRLQPGLAHRHPIGLAKLLDLGPPPPRLRQQVQLLRCRLVLEISVDQPVVGLGFVGLVGDQHRRLIAEARQIVHRADRFALRAGAGGRSLAS